MTVFGIDLGTTYSCIAYVDPSGRATVVRNSDGDETTPSVVWFEEADHIVVGRSAKDNAESFPDQVVSLVKRMMGTDQFRTFFARDYTPEEMSSFILRRLTDDAAKLLDEEVKDVVITVPAYFGIAERDATRKAGTIAGLNVIDIISEPVAAAIDYGVVTADENRTILVYDLGGGTFDTTVIRLEGGNIEVVCTGGNHRLGGADWDKRILDYLLEEFAREHPSAGDPSDDDVLYQELVNASEDIKRSLSTALKRTQRIAHGGATAVIEITRATFEERTRDLLDSTINDTRQTLEVAAGKGVTSIDEVLLVGGATKMPAVEQAVKALLGREARIYDPDMAVAKGAARYAMEERYRQLLQAGSAREAEALAAGLSQDQKQQIEKRTITTVAGRGFGIKIIEDASVSVDRKVIDHLVHANDALPISPEQTYATLYDNQPSVDIELFEQSGTVESREVSDNEYVTGGTLKIPPLPRNSKIKVRFEMGRNGMLKVTATEVSSGHTIQFDAQVGVMSEDQVNQSRTELSGVTVSN